MDRVACSILRCGTSELGSQDYNVRNAMDGEPVVGILIYLQIGANASETAEAVKAKMEELKQRFPEGMGYELPDDTSHFVKASMWEVVKTLGEAMVLVILVVYLFLQSWRATLIPLIAVPISLIGTFAGLWMFGFSINTLTLFAMVLSIGIVVDDAIVVLENIERLMDEEKLSPMRAAHPVHGTGCEGVWPLYWCCAQFLCRWHSWEE